MGLWLGVFANQRHEGFAVLIQLGLPDAGDRKEGFVIGWLGGGHLTQGLVAKHHVGRDALLVSELFA